MLIQHASCNSFPETRDHLFSDRTFSFTTWSTIASRTNLHASQNWVDNITQSVNSLTKSTVRDLTLLSWQSTIYSIWQERNHRQHRSTFWSADVVIAYKLIRNRVQSIRDSNPRASTDMMQRWLATSWSSQKKSTRLLRRYKWPTINNTLGLWLRFDPSTSSSRGLCINNKRVFTIVFP